MMKDLGETIRFLRTTMGITQPQLARALGVSNGIISAWENAVNEPKASYLKRLCDFFDVSADYLLGLVDETSEQGSGDGEFLCPDEKTLLKKYRRLSGSWKKRVHAYIDAVKELPENTDGR